MCKSCQSGGFTFSQLFSRASEANRAFPTNHQHYAAIPSLSVGDIRIVLVSAPAGQADVNQAQLSRTHKDRNSASHLERNNHPVTPRTRRLIAPQRVLSFTVEGHLLTGSFQLSWTERGGLCRIHVCSSSPAVVHVLCHSNKRPHSLLVQGRTASSEQQSDIPTVIPRHNQDIQAHCCYRKDCCCFC